MKKTLALVFSSFLSFNVNAEDNAQDRINKAVNVVHQLCLSGTDYTLSANVDGNITIKKFSPNGQGTLTLNAREIKGATAFQKGNELKIIADQDIRDCTQKHISRIIDAIFEQSKGVEISISSLNNSMTKAKYIGLIPDELKVFGTVNSNSDAYYRFNVSKASLANVYIDNFTSTLKVYLLDVNGNLISSDTYYRGDRDGVRSNNIEVLLLPNNDYFIHVKVSNKKEASSFLLTIEGKGVES